jgi:hypothetical protein
MSIVAAEGAKIVARAAGVLSWLPWALAGMALAAGGGGTLWYRGKWKDCQASVAIDAAKAEEKVRAQKDADAKFTRGLAEQLRPITDAIQEQMNATQIALTKVKSDPNCAHTPAANAFDGVVRPGGIEAHPGQSRPARP